MEGAYIYSEEWNSYRTVKWQAKTDAKGMFVWDYPPDDAVRIRITKSPYREFEQEVVANNQEQTFVLAKPTTIKGSVTDSETGELVNRFKLTPGRWRSGNRATWQDSEGWIKWFTDGRYSYTFSSDADAYAVRIEADGYMPFESQFVDANELEVTIDVALTKGQGPSGYVLDANATPVQRAEVFWQKNIQIRDGQMVNGFVLPHVKTDGDGRFSFKPEDREDSFVAISDKGIGFASYEELARNGMIMLTPWACVHGELRIGTRPAKNRALQLMCHSRLLPKYVAPIYSDTTTDENGRFRYERVYPGEFRLYNQDYEVAPGQMLELYLGGTGRTVRGELTIPGPSSAPIWAILELATLRTPVPFDKWPKPPGHDRMTLAEIEAWYERFAQSPEGMAYVVWLEETYPQSTQSLRVEMDGRSTFHVDNVEPGRYVLKGMIRPSSAHGNSWMNTILGRLWHEVQVPPLTSDADMDVPIDLGTLAVLTGDLKPGDQAPEFDAPTFGSDRIRLADYRGRVLLVTSFRWGFPGTASTTMEDLKALHQRFHENPRYAQVSLLFSGNPVVDNRMIDQAGLDWPHGLLQGPESREATEYGIGIRPHMPWNVLIGPRGDILALGLSGEALQQAVEDALSVMR